jgi:2-polyprenyl-3-methyl-5-hydroxy-6-metoxy-1,4-benzoquinol methylase
MDKNAYNCILCGKKLFECKKLNIFDTRFGMSDIYTLGICSQCEIEQTHPIPTPQELKNLYKQYYNYGGEQGTLYTRLRKLFLNSLVYRLWLSIDGDISFHSRKGNGRLLDVGCNEGRGLWLYQLNGFSVDGLELNEKAAAVARLQGFAVYTQLLEDYQPKDKYDVTVLSNVLEHSLDPKNMLRNTYRILKSEGRVWISCPNSRSWLRSIFGKYWINWHVPFHIVHFTPKSIRKTLQDTGFDQIEIRQETPALWAAHSVIARLFAKRGKPTKQLRNPLIVISLMLFWRGLFFPFLWLGNRLGRGDCLIVTARKR